MKLYVGDDLHSNNNYLAIIDETGKRIYVSSVDQKRF
jgi:hypothetical protein